MKNAPDIYPQKSENLLVSHPEYVTRLLSEHQSRKREKKWQQLFSQLIAMMQMAFC
ncbi:hypothetical protein AB1K62_08485 [Parasphingorhabdus sp. JC815]|uniref:hypothetical protein n=1 Tax=Parasphingorhabdus sp. JC815 TaxID=3232140 RepID=UPI003459DA8A